MDPVAELQADILARLEADEYFADVVALLNQEGVNASDVVNAVKTRQKKSGKAGLVALVDRPLRDVEDADIPGPEWNVLVPVSLYEHPTINRGAGGTGKTIEELISRTCGILHHFDTGTAFLASARDNVTPRPGRDGLILAECLFMARVGQLPIAKVTTPSIAGNAAAVTLACLTPGAAIYYTTDGTLPAPQNPAAPLYAGAVAVSPGSLVRAAAYKAGMQGSDVARKKF